MEKHDRPNPESTLLRRKAEERLEMKKTETLIMYRPYGTLVNWIACYSTNIQSRWDCPVRDNISVENKTVE